MVLLFIRSDCPISNRYAPELERLAREYSPGGIEFRLVYTEAGITAAAIERHRKEYGYSIPGLLDGDRSYVRRAHARITPEATVFVRGELVYRGRIDPARGFTPGPGRASGGDYGREDRRVP